MQSEEPESKIYDCFPFFNELELLKLRIDELNDHVDYFVLVESIETQRGAPKPLYFEENKRLFAPYLHKIIHIIIDEHHPEMSFWERENYQRNCISRGLTNCSPNDIILISDLDEIPRHSIISKIQQELLVPCNYLTRSGQRTPRARRTSRATSSLVSLQQDIYFFHLNRQTLTGETWGGGPWFGTVAVTYDSFQKYGAQHFRNQRGHGTQLRKAGWHFTWIGGKEAVRKKCLSVVEGRSEALEDAEIQHWFNIHPIVPLDDSFPEYVIRNQDYLRSIGFLAE